MPRDSSVSPKHFKSIDEGSRVSEDPEDSIQPNFAALGLPPMRLPLLNDQFPPVLLEKEEVEALIGLADGFVRGLLDELEQFRVDRRGVVDEKRWQPVKQCESLCVHRPLTGPYRHHRRARSDRRRPQSTANSAAVERSFFTAAVHAFSFCGGQHAVVVSKSQRGARSRVNEMT